MVELRFLLLECFLLYSVTLLGKCSAQGPRICQQNEKYAKCVNKCSRCVDRGNCLQSFECTPGCDCEEGYYRNRQGQCVQEQFCDEPGQVPCRYDEVFKECDCVRSCCNRGNPVACNKQCLTGCFCRDDLVRDDYGNCIKPENCPDRELPGKPMCGVNEEIVSCAKPAFCNTCEIRGNCRLRECTSGCDCKDGFYRDSNGRCIHEFLCPQNGNKTCGVNEEIVSCAKPAWCNTCEIRGNCKLKACTPGCDCKSGFYRDSNGRCKHESLCPRNETCGPNQVYLECGTACPDTCDNYGKPRPCTLQCVRGCFCKKGFVKTKGGRCVIPEMCGKRECNEDEVFLSCGTSCPNTCDNYAKPRPCTYRCITGCFCKDGLVRDSNFKCIKPEQCEKVPGYCGKDERFYNCTPSCKNTCKNYNNPGIRCACGPPGCFCTEGLVKDDDGNCMKPEMCPQNQQETCGENEEYQPCGTACQETCKNRGKPRPCTKQCVPGCFCRKGFIRNKDGECVLPQQCEPQQGICREDEEYLECGSACPLTCENYGKQSICTDQCVPGCFCKEGLVRRKDGRCVIPEKCSKQTCNDDEEFQSCGSSCPDTCNNYGKSRICTLECVPGCFCKRGLVRNRDLKCVMPERCVKNVCNRDEVFKRCGTACPETCDNYGKSHPCLRSCVSGCFCRNGLVRDIDTMQCIRPDKCEKIPCGQNAFHSDCASLCPRTCKKSDQVCPAVCVRGCVCKTGLVFDDNRNCIPESQCPRNNNGWPNISVLKQMKT